MFASLYPATMVWMVATIILWFWYDERKRHRSASRMAGLFGLALLVYVPALLAGEGGLFYKLIWIVPRDLLTLLLAVVVSGYIKRNRTFALTLLGFFAFSGMFYWGLLERSVSFAGGLEPSAELLVDLRAPSDLPALRKAFDRLDFAPMLQHISRPDDTELDDYVTVDVPRGALHRLRHLIAALEASPLVDAVEGNDLVFLHQARKPGSYGFNDPRAGDQWALQALRLDGYERLVRRLKPRQQSLLVMIDTGVNGQHEDLAAHYQSVDADSDGDPLGHGTHCAGIAAAVANNRKGIASLAGGPDWLRVASVRVFEGTGRTSQSKVLEGMVKAADAGADVVSMSLGGPAEEDRDRAYQRAVDYIVENGGIVVVSAGNGAMDARYASPANCRQVIVVSALARDGRRASFSNTVGELELGIAAPGAEVLSTFEEGYRELSGTSMSAPYVSGLVAMMKALRPDLRPEEAWRILHKTGIDTADGTQTGRLIQPVQALQAL